MAMLFLFFPSKSRRTQTKALENHFVPPPPWKTPNSTIRSSAAMRGDRIGYFVMNWADFATAQEVVFFIILQHCGDGSPVPFAMKWGCNNSSSSSSRKGFKSARDLNTPLDAWIAGFQYCRVIHRAVVKLLLHYYTDSTGEGKGSEGRPKEGGGVHAS